MEKKAFVALGTLVVGGGLAAGADAQTADPSANVTYDNRLQGAVDARSTNAINLLIGGTVKIKGRVEPEALGQALVDAKQLLQFNQVFLVEPAPDATGNRTFVYENEATLAAGSFAAATGNAGINIAAGDNMAQDNAVAIATVQSSNEALKADLVKLQEAIGNLFNPNPQALDATITNEAHIGDGAFNGLGGNLGANVAAGANIGQQNVIAVTVAPGSVTDVRLATANVGLFQRAEGNRAWLPSTTNTASVGDIGIGMTGNLGVNVAAGTGLLQNNALSITTVK